MQLALRETGTVAGKAWGDRCRNQWIKSKWTEEWCFDCTWLRRNIKHPPRTPISRKCVQRNSIASCRSLTRNIKQIVNQR